MKSFSLTAFFILATVTACSTSQEDGQKTNRQQKMRAGGTCCLPKGSNAAYTYCAPAGDKCCIAVGASSCVGTGGTIITPPTACDAAPPTC